MYDTSSRSKYVCAWAFNIRLLAKEMGDIEKNRSINLDTRVRIRGMCVRKWQKVGERVAPCYAGALGRSVHRGL